MAIKIWQGSSAYNGEPIAAFLSLGSSNRKTGNIDTLWLLPLAEKPSYAVKTGDDRAVCGDCRHKPSRDGTCYVLPYQSPNTIWRTNGGDNVTALEDVVPSSPIVRLGGYGDPAMLPFPFIEKFVSLYRSAIGYSHQWEWCDQRYRKLLLASVDSEEEKERANAMGWRTFRVRKSEGSIHTGETLCINETDSLIQCRDCKLCTSGRSRQNIVVTVHGTQHKVARFNQG